MCSATRAPRLLPAQGLSGHSTRGLSVTPLYPYSPFLGVPISCLLWEGEQLWHRGQGSVKAAERSGGQLGRKSRCSAPWHGAAGSARVGFEDNAWDKSRRAALGIPRQRGDVLARVGSDPNDSSGLARSRGALPRVGEASREPQGAAAQARCASIPNPATPMEGDGGLVEDPPHVWSPAFELLPPPALLLCLPGAAGGTGGGYIWVLTPELARPGTPPDGGICRKANIFVCFH